MLHTLTITGPVYLLIGLGFLSVHRGLIGPADVRVLGSFVARFALPALVFNALSSRAIGEVVDMRFLAGYAAGSLAVMGVSFAWHWRVRRHDVTLASFSALGMSSSNSGYMGYPIVAQVVGAGPAAACLAMCMLVENLLIIPLALLLADSSQSDAGSWQRALLGSLRQLLRNPLILAIIAGFAISVAGWHVPEVLSRSVGLLALASTALSLVVIGGSLVGLQWRGMRRDVAIIATGKLLVHPLAVGLMTWLLLPPADPLLREAAVLYAASPMLGIYPILAQKYGLQGFCAAALLLATLFSFVTVSTILGVFGAHP